MEKFVLSQIRSLGTDPEFAESVLEQIGSVGQAELDELRERERIAIAAVRQCETDILRLATNSAAGSEHAQRLLLAQERQRAATERLYAIRDELRDSERVPPDEEVVRQALRDFDPVWNALAPREQQRVLNLLVQRVDYNGESGNVEITFEPDGFDVFLEQFSERQAVA
jgi:site-specific DNA recombinase